MLGITKEAPRSETSCEGRPRKRAATVMKRLTVCTGERSAEVCNYGVAQWDEASTRRLPCGGARRERFEILE